MTSQFSVDFHCHTNASKDSLTYPETAIQVAHQHGLDRLVITDHNTIDGGLAAFARDPDLVVIGEEIMTTRGEILAFYLTSAVPSGLSPQETIKRLRYQGAFISVSHPFDS
jgi:predicted metal-dependent phosphoesterase TrpH